LEFGYLLKFCYNFFMKYKLFFLIFLVILLINCSVTRKEQKIESTPDLQTEEWLNTDQGLIQTGTASWYGNDFNGKRTANGEIYDMDKLTAAHKYLPFHSLVEVKNLENNKRVLVRINDRGPFVKGRIIDLSRRAAQEIGIEEIGTARVQLRLVKASQVGKISQQKAIDPLPKKNTILKREKVAVSEIRESVQLKSTQPAQKTEFTIPESEDFPPNDQTKKTVKRGVYIQVGAFSSDKNARRLMKQVQKLVHGISFHVEFEDGLYKVISNNMDSRETAEDVKQRLLEYEIEAFIREQ